jgi:hypothetical protein
LIPSIPSILFLKLLGPIPINLILQKESTINSITASLG